MQYLISDVHGNKEKLTDLISHSKTEHITLLGDVGFGFGIDMYFFNQFYGYDFTLVQGNHDNAELMFTNGNCKVINTYTGFYFNTITQTLYIPGAYSYDKSARQEHINWWRNEEMNYAQLEQTLDFVTQNMYDIKTIISHDCPFTIYEKLLNEKNSSSTSLMLDYIYAVLVNNEIKVNWYHGHLHIAYQHNRENLTITGLDKDTGMYIL